MLWGQSDDSPSRGQTLRAVQDCIKGLQSSARGASIHFEPFSTGSHAKIVLHDTKDGQIEAILGSCNWLSSGFDRLELSVKLRDPAITRLIALLVAELARPSHGHWSPLSSDLAGHAANVSVSSSPGGDARAKLILGGAHNDVVLRARDAAERTIVVGSHRLAPSAKSLIVAPFSEAARERSISVILKYAKRERELEALDALFQGDAAVGGNGTLTFEQYAAPVLHAKFLMWDQSDLLVTSQNLMSADASDREQPFSEVGILVSQLGVADKVRAMFSREMAAPQSRVSF